MPNPDGHRILFVGVGRRVSLIEAFRKHCLPGDKLYGTDVSHLVPTKAVLDDLFITSPWILADGKPNPTFVREVEALVDACSIDLVIPLMDDAAEAFRTFWFQRRWLGTARYVDYDKKATNFFFRTLGLTIPEETGPDGYLRGDTVIARPARGGTGSRGVFILRDQWDYQYYISNPERKKTKMVYSKFVEGPEYTVDCFKDFDGNILCVVPRKRLEVRNGEVQKGQTVKHSKVIEEATKIAESLDYAGMMCTQCIEGADGELYWLEINTRFGGGTPLSIAAGADSPLWVWQMVRGEKPQPITDFKEITMLRADREFFSV